MGENVEKCLDAMQGDGTRTVTVSKGSHVMVEMRTLEILIVRSSSLDGAQKPEDGADHR